LREIRVEGDIGELLNEPRIVRELKTVLGEDVPFEITAEGHVDGVRITVRQDRCGGVTAEFTLRYPKEIENGLRDKAVGFDGYASAWFEDRGFMKDAEALGYDAWEDTTWENSEGYYLEWGIGITLRLDDVKDVRDTITKIGKDLPGLRSSFDNLCAEAVRELRKKSS
jgi:hypothetical protein